MRVMALFHFLQIACVRVRMAPGWGNLCRIDTFLVSPFSLLSFLFLFLPCPSLSSLLLSLFSLSRSARKSYLKSLDTIHHQGLHLALGAFCTSLVESLYAESIKPSLYIRREKLSLQYVTKLAANPRNSAYDCVFNPKYERFYNNKPTAIKPLGLRIQPLLEEASINIKNIQPFSFPSKEKWTLNPPKIILDLHKNESHIFKNEFLEIKLKCKHHLSVHTDGSKQDEKVACSVMSPNFTDSIRLHDNSSIFTAEAKAIDIALYHIRDQSEKQFSFIQILFLY